MGRMDERMDERVEVLVESLERAKLDEYFAYASNRKRLLWENLLAGLSRGIGMALGFSVLGALVVFLLQKLALENLPLIGEFIAELVILVDGHL